MYWYFCFNFYLFNVYIENNSPSLLGCLGQGCSWRKWSPRSWESPWSSVSFAGAEPSRRDEETTGRWVRWVLRWERWKDVEGKPQETKTISRVEGLGMSLFDNRGGMWFSICELYLKSVKWMLTQGVGTAFLMWHSYPLNIATATVCKIAIVLSVYIYIILHTHIYIYT